MKTYKIILSDSQISDLSELLIDLRKENLLRSNVDEDQFKDFQNLLKKVVDTNFNCDNESCELKLSYSQLEVLFEIFQNYIDFEEIQEIVVECIIKNSEFAPFFGLD
jgi:hypothetical protein